VSYMGMNMTVWKVSGVPERPGLDVQLVCDTDAAPVIDAIEQAAERHGITLRRVEPKRPRGEAATGAG
jgi:hypothetical protein